MIDVIWSKLFCKKEKFKIRVAGRFGKSGTSPSLTFFFFFSWTSRENSSHFKRPAFKDPMKWKLTVLSWLRSVKPLSYDWLMRHKFRLRRTAKNLKQVVWKGLNPSRSPWLLRVLKFWQYGFYHRRKRESPFQTSAPMTFNFGISGAARSLSFMASSSHFFLQISTCSMQNWGEGGGGGWHTGLSASASHKSFLPARLARVGIPPSAHPSPCRSWPSTNPTRG